MIKAILFDYGGVIADDTLGGKLSERLSEKLGLDSVAAWQLFGPVWHRLTRGRITEEQAWDELEKLYGKPIPANMKDITNSWDRMPRYPEMLDFVQELKRSSYTIGVLSTTVPSTAADIRAHGGYDFFDPIILSCEVGYAKPDPEIYTIAMERLPGTHPNEVVFLDDREMCLPPARELGMHTIHVENPLQAIEATRMLLVSSS